VDLVLILKLLRGKRTSIVNYNFIVIVSRLKLLFFLRRQNEPCHKRILKVNFREILYALGFNHLVKKNIRTCLCFVFGGKFLVAEIYKSV